MSHLCLQVFENLKGRFKQEHPVLSILKESRLEESSENKGFFTLAVPSLFYKERAEKTLLPLLKKELASLLKTDSVHIDIKTCSFLTQKRKKTPITPSRLTPRPSPQIAPTNIKKSPFNSEFTFENFVAGPSNKMAYEAIKQACQTPLNNPYSPLFIYGKTGLGKTHLLHALGGFLLKHKPRIQIQCLSAERFVHQFVTSIRQNQMESFQNQFRKECQVLLVDDIQSIEKALASQEEFFHTFNAITEQGGLVVCSCDRLPNEIKKMETRLQTRLSGGLILQIDSPCLETRLAILQKKSKQKNLALSSEVLTYIAQQSSDISVRELEGILNKLKMLCDFQNQKPSLEFVKESLSNNFTGSSNTVEGLIHQIASKYLISAPLLISKSREKHVVQARNEALLLVHQKFPQLSLSKLGRIFGGRTHSTVFHILKKGV